MGAVDSVFGLVFVANSNEFYLLAALFRVDEMRKYLKKLSDSILDEHNVFAELMLAWIAIMLTLLVILMIVGINMG